MFKELSSGLRKVLAILMAGLFVVSLTAVAASARDGGGRDGSYGHGWGSWGGRIWIWPSVYLRPLLWICVESLHQRVCLDMLMKRTANVKENNFK